MGTLGATGDSEKPYFAPIDFERIFVRYIYNSENCPRGLYDSSILSPLSCRNDILLRMQVLLTFVRLVFE